MQIGEQQKITIGGSLVTVTVKSIEQLDDGCLVVYDVPGYGETQPYWYGGSGIDTGAVHDRSGMPKEYVYKRSRDFRWDYYGDVNLEYQKSILNAFVFRYEEFRRSGRGLYIYSATKGSGKTLLACCLANEIVEKYNAVVKFIGILDYIDLIRQKDEQAEAQKESICRCSLLILDDLGVQTDKQSWIDNALFSLVDTRYRDMLPTIYTANVPINKAAADDRILSRIDGTSIPVILPEISVRHNLAEEYRKDFLRTVMRS